MQIPTRNRSQVQVSRRDTVMPLGHNPKVSLSVDPIPMPRVRTSFYFLTGCLAFVERELTVQCCFPETENFFAMPNVLNKLRDSN